MTQTLKPKAPERTCIVSRKEAARNDLLRFVVGPDGLIHFDPSGKADGRGAYVHPIHLNGAEKKLAQQLKAEPPQDLALKVSTRLRQMLLQQLGLAKRAGALIIGLDNVLNAPSVKGLVVASDAGGDAQRKVATFCLKYDQLLTKQALSESLGVANCTVIGVLGGAWAKIDHLCRKLQEIETRQGDY